ncbi:MAG: hypothetical protein KatS3mg110_3120 [Pirellulaceae bacterium]|nr:MAG: hypothetical protein KatS3mg110_3120 [Pirellulaceae bacterium]
MGRILSWIGKSCVYAAAASFLALVGLVGVLYLKGFLTSERAWDVLSAAYGVAPRIPLNNEDNKPQEVPYEKVLERRAITALDLDLREQALDKAMSELLAQQARLAEDRDRYNRLLDEFEVRLAELQAGATDRAVQDVRQALSVMRPEMAKEQLMKMWQDNQKDAVLTILRTMSPEVRKRILAEFTENEVDQLYSVLKETLEGGTEAGLIQAVKQQIDEFQKSQP